jgi:transcription antitermination factor NusG
MAGRIYQESAGLFALYGFVAIESQWHAAKRTPGVSTILAGSDGWPARVGDDVIDALRAREDAGGFVVLPSQPARPEFLPGDEVTVVNGPLTGLSGLYHGQRNCERVAVLLSLLGAERVVDLARADIRAASDQNV